MTKIKIITPGGCTKISTPTKNQTRPTKYFNKCMRTHLTPNAQPNTEIIKKNSTVCTTKITEWLMRSKQSIKSPSTIKRVPTLCENNLPPTKSNSFPKRTTQTKLITTCEVFDHPTHKST